MKNKKVSYSAFLKNVKDTIKQYDMLEKGDRVLVGVSGGADSVCLLKALIGIKKTLGIDIVVANLDHSLRGAESAKESLFVVKLSKELGVECVSEKINVKSRGVRGMSVEEKARDARYKFFCRIAKEKRCTVIATGHTMNDQSETVIMKILYGSSISGLSGIPPVRKEKQFRIIRPLIRTGRKDIIGFLDGCGLHHIEDSSNKDMRFRRNRIRQEILPYLEKYSPRIKRLLVNLSDTLREDISFIEDAKKNVNKNKGTGKSGSGEMKVKELLSLPETVRKTVLKELFINSGGNVKKLTYRHWIDMNGLIKSSGKGKSLDLPGNVAIVKKKGKIVFIEKQKN
ncbi:MAG: tRNA lysidine(34) synthetase TilS [Candidatus Aadella gelida]|nr:tRNA lysidine(34) synthetase TilS [Candidatus Aadella gelida]